MSGGSKKKILSNSVWMIIQHLYSMLTSLTVVALIARYLGPSDYGLINYCASVISIFTTLAGLGLDNLIVSEIIRNPEKEGGYLGTALVMRLITSFVSYPLFLGVIALLHPGDKVLFIVAVLQGLGMIFQTYDVLHAMELDCGKRLTGLKVDGGASHNSFLLQFQADLSNSGSVYQEV